MSRHGVWSGPAERRLRRLVRGGRRGTPGPGPGPAEPGRVAPLPLPLVLDLVAALLDAGAPVEGAVTLVADALTPQDPSATALRRALGTRRIGDGDGDGIPDLADALDLATATGLAPAVLVRAAAVAQRRRSAVAQVRALRRLEVLMVLPAGLCLLPAFVLLGVVPIVLDLLRG